MNYNVFEYMKAYNDNIDIINAYLKNETIEGYQQPSNAFDFGNPPKVPVITIDDTDFNKISDNASSIMGMGIGIFLVIFLLVLITYIIAIYMLIANWSKLPDWAKATGLICLLFGLSIGTIIVVVVARDDKLANGSNKSK